MNSARYLVHGATLTFAWFLLLNAAASVIIALASARLTKRSAVGSPGLWLALRLAPAALSAAFVAIMFVPSYWKFEPTELVEGFDVSLTTLALLGVVVAAKGAGRGFMGWRRAKRRTDAWIGAGRPFTLVGATMPAYVIDAVAPVMALVGVWRPRLLVTSSVLEALTDEELRAAAAHEQGHWRAFDNLKRLAICAVPDLLSATSTARTLERRWAAAAEHTADLRAASSDSERCALASALIKVARLTPMVTLIAEPISALVDGGDITARVQRLLEDTPATIERRRFSRLPLFAAAAALAFAYAPLLRIVHDVTEILVNSLP